MRKLSYLREYPPCPKRSSWSQPTPATLGNANPQRPPGMSTVQGQYDLAVAAGLPILQWRDPGLAADPAQQSLLALPTVIATGFSEFRQYIKTRLTTLAEETKRKAEAPPAPAAGTSFLFVDVAPEDRVLADQLEDLRGAQGLYFGLPMFDDDLPAVEKLRDLEDNLVESDAVILVYHRASLPWVREQLRWCRKVTGKRDAPHKLIAVCLDQPPEKKKVGMNLPKAPSCLPEVIDALK